ncbi:MAG TPA: segregation/condensation protein A [Candidatus Paceibacterota bacterium]|nr:segregation/condensation protein A [Candidatus Paceibacterota bacterium]
MTEKIGQEQFNSFVFGEKLSWQEIIYDLINSEQLDPWDINLVSLSQKYLEKIRELEEANFVLSSKVLLVCSLLLRIKSELLINHYIKSLDDVLFNKREESAKEILKQIEEEYEEIPLIVPKTPLPRFKKVSLDELMKALSKAINTETRREVRKSVERELEERTKLFIPKKSISLAQRIKEVHEKVVSIFKNQEKISFTDFAGEKKEDRVDKFIPLLHLDTQNKLWLEQERYLEEIWILKQRLKKIEDEMDNEIITDNIERNFEDILEEKKLEEEGWEKPDLENKFESEEIDVDEFVEESELNKEID